MKKPTVKELEKILNSKRKSYIIINKDGSLSGTYTKPKPTMEDLERYAGTNKYEILPNGKVKQNF